MIYTYTRYYHEEYLHYRNQLGDLHTFMGEGFETVEEAIQYIKSDPHLVNTVRTIYLHHPKSVLEFREKGRLEKQVLASEIL